MPEDRVVAGVVTGAFLTEGIDIRVDPANLRVLHECLMGVLQRARQKPVIGIQEIDRLDGFPGAEHILDAGVARRT